MPAWQNKCCTRGTSKRKRGQERAHTRTHARTHARTHTCTHARMHTCTHSCTQACLLHVNFLLSFPSFAFADTFARHSFLSFPSFPFLSSQVHRGASEGPKRVPGQPPTDPRPFRGHPRCHLGGRYQPPRNILRRGMLLAAAQPVERRLFRK